jgi:hypothetical protein
MKFGPQTLGAVYSVLLTLEPFCDWKLPAVEQITFEVDNDPANYGMCYRNRIVISSACCGHLSTLIRTMAHEMIHIKRQKNLKWAAHDKEFSRLAYLVGNSLGIDPLDI